MCPKGGWCPGATLTGALDLGQAGMASYLICCCPLVWFAREGKGKEEERKNGLKITGGRGKIKAETNCQYIRLSIMSGQ